MRRRFLLMALLAAAPVLAETLTPLSVVEVMTRKAELDGKVVTVRGWLDRCANLSCGLYPTREAARSSGNRPFLSIGASPVVDNHLDLVRNAEVVIEARFDAKCVPPSDYICLDRVPELDPVRLVQVITPAR